MPLILFDLSGIDRARPCVSVTSPVCGRCGGHRGSLWGPQSPSLLPADSVQWGWTVSGRVRRSVR